MPERAMELVPLSFGRTSVTAHQVMRREKRSASGCSRIVKCTPFAACELSAQFTNFRLPTADVAIENSRNGTPPDADCRVVSAYRCVREIAS